MTTMFRFYDIAFGLPITSLEVLEDNVLVGEGPYLHLYDVSQHPPPQAPSQSVQVLSHHVIHGIREGKGSCFAVFGQKALNFVKIDTREKSITVLCEVREVSDWIWDVCWLRSADEPLDRASDRPAEDEGEGLCSSNVALATGHNVVILWDPHKMLALCTVYCQENCILYCARLIGQTWGDLVVAAGTVFNQVVFWRPLGPRDESGRVIVDHRFKGHQGVIFNITYDADSQMLATVSDDRSIRLWRFDYQDLCEGESGKENRPCEAEQVFYGHSARVWCAKFLQDRIVSVGEDAQCCIWNMKGEIIEKFRGHKGKSIWSLAAKPDGSLVVTGGGDGSVRLWSRLKQPHVTGDVTTTLRDVCREVKHLVTGPESVPGGQMEAELVPRMLLITNQGHLLVMTQGGYLFGWSSACNDWHLVMHDGRYQSYSIMAAAPSAPLVAIGNIHGSVKLIALDQFAPIETEVQAYKGNVFNVTWATDGDLFTTGMEGELIWWKVSQDMMSLTVRAHGCFVLPTCRQRWATSVALVGEGSFVCGDRRGSVHLYQCPQNQEERVGPTSSVPGVHGKAGTSFICVHDGVVYSTGRDATYRQYSISESGQLRLDNTHKVAKGFEWLERLVFTEEGDIHVLGFHSVNFVVWSTGSNQALLTVPCGGGHRAWDLAPLDDGSTAFVCIKTKQLLFSRVPPAAWQRQTILKTDIHGREITCIKFLRTIQSSGHSYHVCATGSEDTNVNIIAVIQPEDRAKSQTLPGRVEVLHRFNAHVSSVRALDTCVSNCLEDGALLFSVGGRCTINCWRLRFHSQRESQWKVSSAVRHMASHSSLTTTRSRRKFRQCEKFLDPETRFLGLAVWRGCHGDVMMVVASSDAIFRLFCFDENSCQIVPLGTSTMHDCCLLSTTLLSDAIDPKVRGQRAIVLTGGTDGRVAVWDVTGTERTKAEGFCESCQSDSEEEETEQDWKAESTVESTSSSFAIQHSSSHVTIGNQSQHKHWANSKMASHPSCRTESGRTTEGTERQAGCVMLAWTAHQSGVNALASRCISDCRWLVVSGGDDNAIAVALLNINSDVQSSVIDTLKLPMPHAAQVTGIKFTSDLTFLSSSIDQRLNMWRVQMSADLERIEQVQMLSSRFVHVADVAGLDSWQDSSGVQHVALCGQGLQLLANSQDRTSSGKET